jgi:hypothetical protein
MPCAPSKINRKMDGWMLDSEHFVPLKERYLLSSTLDVVNPNKNINILF